MNRLSTIKPTAASKLMNSQIRLLSTTQIALGKSVKSGKKKSDQLENLMSNAHKWEESNATESEAVVKADHEPNIDPEILKQSENLMSNAPKWEESNATESEADVKADHEPNIDPQILKEQTAEWIRSHNKDDQGNIRK